MKTWQFEPLDSSFFRGARSFQQNEQGFLESQFPPTAQTLAGVVRSGIAEGMGVDWQAFRNGQQQEIADLIGHDADHAGKLSFVGPYLLKDGKRLYPMPLHVLYSSQNDAWGKLAPSEKEYATDMGKRHLPEVVDQAEGAKPLEDAWLDADNINRVLNGEDPTSFHKKDGLFKYESRTGIARNNHKRTIEEGALFFTRHIRLKGNIKLAMDVNGADDITPAPMLRLGGEGRMAHVAVSDVVDSRLRRNDTQTEQFMLVLLTHGDFNGKAEPSLPEDLKIISACIGKAVREGGWDYRKRRPKPLKSLVPAGSVYFIQGDASKLQGNHIGERTRFGYGEFIIGKWEQ
ncbi:MAG: type III-B CRISPR module-associated protein Cmr3 [Mariprofundaceae bacterium]|nr:type III-B CRISPR module-associated protein Cmr3 [Mariprofundaceae bacterium]